MRLSGTGCDPNPEAQCADVDLAAGLRLARQRDHERDYSHEWDDEAG
jgi:hypothetical protein